VAMQLWQLLPAVAAVVGRCPDSCSCCLLLFTAVASAAGQLHCGSLQPGAASALSQGFRGQVLLQQQWRLW
jgi:hypothetical protein